MKTTLRILEIEETCTGCGGCVSVCAKNALSLSTMRKVSIILY
ncbi:4Fe-4S binding protein [Bacteroides salyersiae]|nr:4Fe-4S binding protein [Bacteroides salyersiae]